jgi:Transposase IS66 family
MYQIFIGGQNMMRVRDGLARMFGIFLPVPSMYRFKQTVSAHYKGIYDSIARTIIGSPVLYIDETSVNLRSETGYVWCVTDGHSVHYFYKNSREGSFLTEMFRDFKGVLVSDFYTAYDSLDCMHQRCLVHLIRDFNEEMQKHPFDAELRLLGEKFAVVLHRAVATIDRYGFKKRHLAKHTREADSFIRWAASREFTSPPAERLRLRIDKYRDQLYTFMKFDGVSWNNNNAEHYIKPFAKHRRTAKGKFTARSIGDYLVLLSIAETSKGRRNDFIEFLLENSEDDISFGPRRNAPSASLTLPGI